MEGKLGDGTPYSIRVANPTADGKWVRSPVSDPTYVPADSVLAKICTSAAQSELKFGKIDIAYSLGMNDHPEFGGLELTLRDVVHAR